jgi:XXXCH domain-containing protein
MVEEKERKFGRLELADYLGEMSRQLREGRLEAEGRTWTVPDEVEVKLELKEKHGRLQAKLSWRWETLKEYDQASRETVTRWQGSFKEVKIRLAACFKKVQQAAAQGLCPDDQAVMDLVEASQAFHRFTRPEWQGPMQEYLEHLANLERAVAGRRLEEALHELQDLKNCMISCHQEFK